MTALGVRRERQAWIAAVAILATSLAWLAAIDLVLLLAAHGRGLEAVLAVLRVMLKVARTLVEHSLPVVPAIMFALVAIGVLGGLISRPGVREGRPS